MIFRSCSTISRWETWVRSIYFVAVRIYCMMRPIKSTNYRINVGSNHNMLHLQISRAMRHLWWSPTVSYIRTSSLSEMMIAIWGHQIFGFSAILPPMVSKRTTTSSFGKSNPWASSIWLIRLHSGLRHRSSYAKGHCIHSPWLTTPTKKKITNTNKSFASTDKTTKKSIQKRSTTSTISAI